MGNRVSIVVIALFIVVFFYLVATESHDRALEYERQCGNYACGELPAWAKKQP